MTDTLDHTPLDLEQSLPTAGEAVAPLLPSAGPLAPGVPQPAALVDPAAWAAAAVAPLERVPGAMVGVLVPRDLVDALAAAPNGALDVAAAVQPALDAAAAALGASAGQAQTVTGPDLAATLVAASTALPLLADGQTGAVLFVSPGESPAPATSGFQAGAGFATPAAAGSPTPARGVELLHGVTMEVTVELGRTRLSVRELLALSPGDVLELDRAAGSPADLLVNGRLIARGEVVVVDEDFALRVTEIVAHSSLG